MLRLNGNIQLIMTSIPLETDIGHIQKEGNETIANEMKEMRKYSSTSCLEGVFYN